VPRIGFLKDVKILADTDEQIIIFMLGPITTEACFYHGILWIIVTYLTILTFFLTIVR